MSDRRCIFVGNIGDASQLSIKDFLERSGLTVTYMDLKLGYAFAYVQETDDLADTIKTLCQTPFGSDRRYLRLEFSKGGNSVKSAEERRQQVQDPTEALFVVGFDPRKTFLRDLEGEFSRFGRLSNVEVKRNFAFIEFTNVEDATEALKSMDGIPFMGRKLSVQYAVNSKRRKSLDDYPVDRYRETSDNTYRRDRDSRDRYSSTRDDRDGAYDRHRDRDQYSPPGGGRDRDSDSRRGSDHTSSHRYGRDDSRDRRYTARYHSRSRSRSRSSSRQSDSRDHYRR